MAAVAFFLILGVLAMPSLALEVILECEPTTDTQCQVEPLKCDLQTIKSIRIVSDNVTQSFDNMVVVDLRLKQLPESIFREFPGLRTLTIINCSLTSVSDVGELQELIIMNNRITELTKGFFTRSAPNLRRLYLGFNSIEWVSDDAFADCDFAENFTLELPNNRLETLPRGFLQTVPNLRTLNLASNLLTEIDFTFVELPFLKHLDLSGNLIDSIIKRTFMDLVALESLDISRNKIERLDASSFMNNRRLAKLDLSENKLSWYVDLNLPWANLLPTNMEINLANNSFNQLIIKSPYSNPTAGKEFFNGKWKERKFIILDRDIVGPVIHVDFSGNPAPFEYIKIFRLEEWVEYYDSEQDLEGPRSTTSIIVEE